MQTTFLPRPGDVRQVVNRFFEDGGLLLASALSFGIVLCLAPLTLIIFSVAGFLLSSDEIATYVFDSASLFLPAYVGPLAEFLVLLTKQKAITGLVGAAGLAIFASNVFSLIRQVLNRSFRVRDPRGIITGFAFNVLLVLLVGAVVVVVALTIVLLVAVRDLARTILPFPPLAGLWRGLSLAAIYSLGTIMLFIVYRMFPDAPVRARVAAIAAVTVTVMWELARLAFSAYVQAFGVYGQIYGSFGIWIAGLVWIYYSSIIFVLGAELAAVLTGTGVSEPAAPQPIPALASSLEEAAGRRP